MPKATNKDAEKMVQDAMEPVVAFNTLMMNTAEKAVAMQIESAQKLAKIGFANWAAALNVKTADDAQAYASQQQDVAKEVVELVSADSKAYGELGQAFVNDSKALVEKNLKKAA